MKRWQLALLNIAALALFAFGAIAPLTPSEGSPPLGTVLIFAVLPVALLLACVFTANPNRPAQLMFLAQGVGITVVALNMGLWS
jgi:hypothetical protein